MALGLKHETGPLKIGIIHREDSWHRGEARIDGQFAYKVPQLTWEFLPVGKGFNIDLFDFKRAGSDYDIIFFDDGKYKDYAGFSPNVPHGTYQVPQVVMYALYPTLTAGHFTRRVERANKNADLVLLDHDSLACWREFVNVPVRRLAYSVNERYYNDRGLEKDIDVGFYCVYGWNKERPAVDKWLAGYCSAAGLKYATTHGENVGTKYAELLARTKVVVHLNRTPETRAPRIFDAAACGCCVISNEIPEVSGECFEDGRHYWRISEPCSKEYKEFTPEDVPEYKDLPDLESSLEAVLSGNIWREIGEDAKQYILSCHTWEQRAKQLYRILLDSFPALRRGREEWMYQ